MKVNIFKYLRTYLLCSIFISFNAALSITTTTRFINFNSYLSMFYTSYIYVPLMGILNLYASFLNNLMMVERICILLKKTENFFVNSSPYLFGSSALLLATLINIPLFFSLEPSNFTIDLNDNTSHTFHVWQYTSFFYSSFGHVIVTAHSILKDCVALFLEIGFNLVSTIIFKKYLAERATLIGLSNGISSRSQGQPPQVDRLYPSTSNQMSRREQVSTLRMVLALSIFSIISHILFFVSNVVSIFNLSSFKTLNLLYTLSHCLMLFKANVNFLVLVILNKKFKERLNSKFLRFVNC
jgi:hypothetical protein